MKTKLDCFECNQISEIEKHMPTLNIKCMICLRKYRWNLIEKSCKTLFLKYKFRTAIAFLFRK